MGASVIWFTPVEPSKIALGSRTGWVASDLIIIMKWSRSEVAQSCPTLCDPMDCSLPGSLVHGMECSLPGSSVHGMDCSLPGSSVHGMECSLPGSSVHGMDCSLPGSSVHGIFQARVLEWVAISFSRGSSRPRDRTWVSRVVGRRFTVWATR